MKVILLTDIPKVGNKYDVKDFAQGYAQNVLLAKGLAELATPHALAKIADKKAKQERIKEEEAKRFADLISSVNDTKIVLKAKANGKGHLFKAVSPKDVASAIHDITGIEIDADAVVMEHIKELGTHTVRIKKGDKEGKCQIIIEAQ